MSTASDIERVLLDADRLADAVMQRDKAEPGFAAALVRALIIKLPDADAAAIAKHTRPIDPAAMIG
jgi:hypothetical protein